MGPSPSKPATSGPARRCRTGADRPCKLASIVKLPLAVHVLGRVGDGQLELGDRVAVEARHVCPGSGLIARRFRVPGLSLSVDNLLRLALAESDNTATDVFDRVGGPVAVQRAADEWGHGGVRVDRTVRAMIGDLYGIRIEDGHNPKTVLRDARPSGDHTRAFFADALDTATPRAVADLLADLWAGHPLPPETTEWLVSVLSTCRTGDRRFRARLPAGFVMAQKTGTLWGGAGRMVADAGVVRLSGDAGHAAVAAFLTGSERPKREQEAVLAHVARIVVRAFQ